MNTLLGWVGLGLFLYILGIVVFVYPQSRKKHGDDTAQVWKDVGLALLPIPIVLLVGRLLLNRNNPTTKFDKKIIEPSPVSTEDVKNLKDEIKKSNENIKEILENIEDTMHDTTPTTINPDFEERLRRKSRDS